MEKLANLRIGGKRVFPGLLPVDAVQLVRDLIAAFREFGGDAEAWDNANPHISITGAGSTVATIMSEFAGSLRPAVNTFRQHARVFSLSGKSREFVEQNFRPSAPWLYLELLPDNGVGEPVKFDYSYREKLLESLTSTTITGIETLYGRVVRVGGDRPPTVKIDFMGHGPQTVKLKGKDSHDLAKLLGARLYETVHVRGVATWDKETLRLVAFDIESMDKEWHDFSLTQLIEEGDGTLPVRLTVNGEPEIIQARGRARGEIV